MKKVRIASIVTAAVFLIGALFAVMALMLHQEVLPGLEMDVTWAKASYMDGSPMPCEYTALYAAPRGVADVKVRVTPADPGVEIEWSLEWEGEVAEPVTRYYGIYPKAGSPLSASVVCFLPTEERAILKASIVGAPQYSVSRGVVAPIGNRSSIENAITDIYLPNYRTGSHPLVPNNETDLALSELTQATFLQRTYDGGVTSGWAEIVRGDGMEYEFCKNSQVEYTARQPDGTEVKITMKDVLSELYMIMQKPYLQFSEYSYLQMFPILGLEGYQNEETHSKGDYEILGLSATEDTLTISMYQPLTEPEEQAFFEALSTLPVLKADVYCVERTSGIVYGTDLTASDPTYGKFNPKAVSNDDSNAVFSGTFYVAGTGNVPDDYYRLRLNQSGDFFYRQGASDFYNAYRDRDLKVHIGMKYSGSLGGEASYGAGEIVKYDRYSYIFKKEFGGQYPFGFAGEYEKIVVPNGGYTYMGMGKGLSFRDRMVLAVVAENYVLNEVYANADEGMFDRSDIPGLRYQLSPVIQEEMSGMQIDEWIRAHRSEFAPGKRLKIGVLAYGEGGDSPWLDGTRENTEGAPEMLCGIMNTILQEELRYTDFDIVPMSALDLAKGVQDGSVDIWITKCKRLLSPTADYKVRLGYSNDYFLRKNPWAGDWIQDREMAFSTPAILSYPMGSEEAYEFLYGQEEMDLAADMDAGFSFREVILWQECDFYIVPKDQWKGGYGYETPMTPYRSFFTALKDGFVLRREA